MTVCVLIFCLFGTIRPVHSSSFRSGKPTPGGSCSVMASNRTMNTHSEDKFSILLTNLNSVLAGDTTFHAGVSPLGRAAALSLGTRSALYDWRRGESGRLGLASKPAQILRNIAMTIISESRRKQRRRRPKGKSHIAASCARSGHRQLPGQLHAQHGPQLRSEGVIPRRLPKKINDLNATLGRLDLDPNHGESEHARWYMTDEDLVPYSSEF